MIDDVRKLKEYLSAGSPTGVTNVSRAFIQREAEKTADKDASNNVKKFAKFFNCDYDADVKKAVINSSDIKECQTSQPAPNVISSSVLEPLQKSPCATTIENNTVSQQPCIIRSESSLGKSEERSFMELFVKARQAVKKSTQLRKDYIIGINTAEELVRARYEAPLCTDKSVSLQNLLAQLVSHFPTAPDEIKNISGPLTWREYRLAVEKLINWKTPQDIVKRTPSKGPVMLDYLHYGDKLSAVGQGFVPKPHGIIGELVILLCLAHNVAPYGFPLKFEDNHGDVLSADTTQCMDS